MSGKGVNTGGFSLWLERGIPRLSEAFGVLFCIIQRAFGLAAVIYSSLKSSSVWSCTVSHGIE
jgi:hypothetical protein